MSQAKQPAIETSGLMKRFRRQGGGGHTALPWRRRRSDLIALHPLDLTVEQGSTTGVIGPNGSGKSTLVRVLATLVLPDAGWARVFGHDVVTDSFSVKRHINRVSVEAAFFKELSAWENLAYASRIYGVAGRGLRRRVEAVLGRFGLPRDVLDMPLRHLSRGQQQKVAIARSVLTTPSLLLMDEPTTGLDPRSKREVQQMVIDLRQDSVTTLLGICTFAIFYGLARTVVVLVIAMLLFHLDLSHANLFTAVTVMAVSTFPLVGLGILASVLPLLSPERGEQMTVAVQGVLLLASGVYYPVSVLPGPVQALARVNPLTYTLDGMRAALIGGRGLAAVAPDLLPLLVMGLLLLPAGLAAFGWAERRAKRLGLLKRSG